MNRQLDRRLLGALALLSVFLLGPACAAAQGPAVIQADTVKKVKKATAYVKVEFPSGQTAEGSGFFAMEPGIVLTNAHVVGMLRPTADKPRSVEIVVNSGQKEEFKLTATVLGVDRVHDLAVLKVEGAKANLPTPLAVETDLTKLVETQKVYIFGFPFGARLGREISVTESSIASFRNDDTGTLFQIQVNGGMHPGNSGGPVVDSRGIVVGVSVAGLRGTTVNFAVPSEKVHSMLHGRVQETKVGERFRDQKQIKLPILKTFLDPLERIKEVKLEYWIGAAGPARAGSLKAPAALPGDGDRQSIDLSFQQGLAKNDLVLPTLPAGKVYWLQTVYASKAGVKHWGPATSYKPADTPPLERVPADLTVNTDVKMRSMSMVSKYVFELAKGKEKISEVFIMDLQILEVLEKNDQGNGVKLVLGKGGFFALERGKRVPRHALAQASVKGTVFGYGNDLNGRLNSFGFVKYKFKDLERMEEANDMAGDVTVSYQAACLGMPNRKVEAQEVFEEKMRMLMGQGDKKDVIDLVLQCTYEGSRTVNDKTEAVISMTGRVNLIKSPRPIKGAPQEKLSGNAVFNVTDGMVSKLKLAMMAEFEMGEVTMTRIFEIDYTREPGNIYSLKAPAGPVAIVKGKTIFQQNGMLAATDAANPLRKGTRQKVFQVKFEAGKTYVIDMKQPPGTKLDPYLRLEDSTGKVLAEDDDSGGGPNKLDARIIYKAAEAGTYRVIATSYAPNNYGAFNLAVFEAADTKAK